LTLREEKISGSSLFVRKLDDICEWPMQYLSIATSSFPGISGGCGQENKILFYLVEIVYFKILACLPSVDGILF